MHCHILNIGPDLDVHRSLMEFMEAEGLGTPQHIETGAIALGILGQLPEPELPHIVVIPFRLPILTGVDFIARMRSHERLRSIPIFVWGPHIPADEIKQIYTAGGACVFPGEFNSLHLEALRQFCRTWSGTETDLASDKPRPALTTALLRTGEKAVRNARLGGLFVWTGCISTLLWLCALLLLGTSGPEADLAPLSVYAALVYPGFSLMGGHAGDRARA